MFDGVRSKTHVRVYKGLRTYSAKITFVSELLI